MYTSLSQNLLYKLITHKQTMPHHDEDWINSVYKNWFKYNDACEGINKSMDYHIYSTDVIIYTHNYNSKLLIQTFTKYQNI